MVADHDLNNPDDITVPQETAAPFQVTEQSHDMIPERIELGFDTNKVCEPEVVQSDATIPQQLDQQGLVDKGKRPMENQLDSNGFNVYNINRVVGDVAEELEKAKSARKKLFDLHDYMDYDLEEESDSDSLSDTVSDPNWKAGKEGEDDADTSESEGNSLKGARKGKQKVDEAGAGGIKRPSRAKNAGIKIGEASKSHETRREELGVEDGLPGVDGGVPVVDEVIEMDGGVHGRDEAGEIHVEVTGVDTAFEMDAEKNFVEFAPANIRNFDESRYDPDILRTPAQSDDEDEGTTVQRHTVVDPGLDDEMANSRPQEEFKLGKLFVDVKTFREYMVEHSINEGYEPDFSKRNGPDRVQVGCKVKECPFKVVGVKMNKVRTFQVRQFVNEHTCSRAFTSRRISGKWIAKHFIQLIRNEPKVKSKTIAEEISKTYKFDAKKWNCQEGIRIAREKLRGNRVWQFERIRDYGATVVKHNPGSRSIIHVNPIPIPGSLRPRFERFYMCLNAYVEAFKECRPFIGLDGCHLKGMDGGQLLSAITRDADNRLIPIAYAWVESETRDSWTWFLEILKMDIGDQRQVVFMSDRQKGLITAVEEVWPGYDHRFCAMHIHNNMKTSKNYDEGVKNRFWAAAGAYNVHRHKEHMEWLKQNHNQAWKYLNEIDTKTWCRYEFHPSSKTDLIVNNCCESWNAKIKDARDKPPVSLMESLRRMEMVEFEERRSQAEKHEGPLMENVMKIIEKKKSLTRGMGIIMYAGQLEFEVMVGTFYQYKVDLNTKTCSCLEWGLSGIPCAHAAACIMHARLDFAPFVDPCYHIETMRRIYRTIIHPLPGTNDWVQTQLMGTDPPVFRKKTGRPKKIRKRGPTEKTDHTGKRLTKHGLKQYCSGCGHTGHNKRCCPVLKAASGEASQPQNASQQIPSQEGCQQVSSQMKRKGNFSGDDGVGPSSQPMQSHKRSKNLVMEDHDGGLSQPSQPIPSQPIPSQTRPSQSRVQKNKGQNKGKKKGNNAAPETARYVREELPDESQQDPSQTRPSQSRVQKNKGQNKGKKKGNNAAPETASYAREELPDESQQDPSQTRPSQSRVQKKQGYKGKKQDKSSKTATASHATASHVTASHATASHAEGSRQNDTIILDDDDDIVLSDCRDIVLSPQPLKTKKTKVYRQGWRKSPRKGRQFRSTQ